MNDQEAYDYYANPEHLKIAGPARKHPKDRLTKTLFGAHLPVTA